MRFIDIFAAVLVIVAAIIVIVVRTWYETKFEEMKNTAQDRIDTAYKEGWSKGSFYFLNHDVNEIKQIREHFGKQVT